LGDWFMGAVKNVSNIITPVLKTVANKNPAVKSLLSVGEILTKGNKLGSNGGGKKGKGKSGKGFLVPPSIANNDKAMKGGNKKWAPTGKKIDSAAHLK